MKCTKIESFTITESPADRCAIAGPINKTDDSRFSLYSVGPAINDGAAVLIFNKVCGHYRVARQGCITTVDQAHARNVWDYAERRQSFVA